jgi:hypothetical protein
MSRLEGFEFFEHWQPFVPFVIFVVGSVRPPPKCFVFFVPFVVRS